MAHPQICVAVDRGHDGGAPSQPRRGRGRRPGRDAARLRGPARRRRRRSRAAAGRSIVTCRPFWEGGRFRRPGGGTAADPGGGASPAAPNSSTSSRAPRSRRPDPCPPRPRRRPLVAHLRGRSRAIWRSDGQRSSRPAPKSSSSRPKPDSLSDTLRLMRARRCQSQRARPRACPHRDGRRGLASRVLASRLRNRWTYAGDQVAPGQFSATRLLKEFRIPAISSPMPPSSASSATRSAIRCRRRCTTPASRISA